MPGYTDFLVKLTAIALQKHPMLPPAGRRGQSSFRRQCDIGIAVDTEAGLWSRWCATCRA